MLTVLEPHTALFIAPTGEGKTHLALDLLEREYFNHFGFIVIICTTLRCNETYHQRKWFWTDPDQWRGGSEAAGDAARLMAPPQSYFFCLLVWDAYHVVGTACKDRRSLRNTFEWMRALQAPSSFMVQSWWRSILSFLPSAVL